MLDKVHYRYGVLTESLIESGYTITLMESCTSGLVSSLITDTEGSSAAFKGSVVAYSNEAKIAAGVDKDVLDEFGVYSFETAEAMATACRDSYGADIGIGITGSLGTMDPNNDDSVPGDVFYAINYFGRLYDFYVSVDGAFSRFESKLAVADAVCRQLQALLDD